MTTGTLLLLILIILLIAALPAWPYSRSWGYYPSGGVGVVLAIIIILFLLGHI
jgi:hypothetical protein